MSLWWWMCIDCGGIREVSGMRNGRCQNDWCSLRPQQTRSEDKKTKTVCRCST